MRKLRNIELQRKTVDEFKKSEKLPFSVVLDNIRSLNNIGSVFRTSDAFLIEHIYLCGITATPPNKEIHKTALGATESVDWSYHENTETVILQLQQKNYTVVSVEQVENSISLPDFKIEKDKKYAFIFGHEVKGVQQKIVDMSDFCVEIPQYGTKHSLNISVSAGVVIWEMFRKYKFG
jgi:tRNA G18 (ribose-2'-O)-methylase SpoU